MTSIEAGAILQCDPCYGTLTIDGIDMLSPYGAWCLPDLSPLWGSPEVRGSDQPMPGVSGVRAKGRRPTLTVHQLAFWCSGQVDGQTGALAADMGRTPEHQLAVNMAYLHAQVFAPIPEAPGTRPAVWTPPGVGAINADIRVRLPANSVALRPKAILRGMLTLEDPHYDLHL